MHNSHPVVTIGVPVFNGAAFIDRALASLTAQTYDDLEIVVSDNASTDATADIVKGHAARDGQIAYLRRDSTVPVYENFRGLVEHARGEYFMWASADDVWRPRFVEVLLAEMLAHPEADLAMSAIEPFSEDGSVLGPVHLTGDKDPSAMSHLQLAKAVWKHWPYHVFVYGLYRTEFLRRAFQNVPEISGAGKLFMCQVSLATRVRYVDEVLYARQMSPKSFSERYAGTPGMPGQRLEWRDLELCGEASRFLVRSQVVPTARKAYIPIVLGTIVGTRVIGRNVKKLSRLRARVR